MGSRLLKYYEIFNVIDLYECMNCSLIQPISYDKICCNCGYDEEYLVWLDTRKMTAEEYNLYYEVINGSK